MSELTKRLRERDDDSDFRDLCGLIEEAADEIERLEEEAESSHWLCARQSDLLTGVVNAIRGHPPTLTLWSHHNAPDLAKAQKAVVDAARVVAASSTVFYQPLEDAIRALDALDKAND